MFGRGASRIELRMEEDLQEYDEFKQQMIKQKASEQMSKIAQIQGAFGIIGTGSSILRPNAFSSYDQISNYANFQNSKGPAAVGARAGPNRKRKSGANDKGLVQGFNNSGGNGGGMNDDSMNDSF